MNLINEKTKFRPLAYTIFQPRQLERYLEKQAEDGWMPIQYTSLGIKFALREPEHRRYCAGLYRAADSVDVGDDYLRRCERAGWHLCCVNSRRNQVVFSSPAEKRLPPLRADPAGEAEALRCYGKKSLKNGFSAIGAFLLYLYFPGRFFLTCP